MPPRAVAVTGRWWTCAGDVYQGLAERIQVLVRLRLAELPVLAVTG